MQHGALCRHTIFTHTVHVELKRRFDITMTEQCLYRLRVGLATDQERRQAVTQVMEAESTRVILHQLTFFVLVR